MLGSMNVIKEAAAAMSEKVEADIKAGKSENEKIFSSEEEGQQFFKPFFEKQSEIKDLMPFIEQVFYYRKYELLGGGLVM